MLPEKLGRELEELLLDLSGFLSSLGSSFAFSAFLLSFSGTNFFHVLMRDFATVIISSSLLLFLKLLTVIPILEKNKTGLLFYG